MSILPPISKTPSIYQIRHIKSGKVYVGSAANPRYRWSAHLKQLRNGKHHSRHLQRAWDKYGEDTFVFEILEPVLFIEDLLAREQYWIDTLQAASGDFGYNTSPTAGSPLGVKHTEETRAKTSERSKAQYADPAAREKQSERMRKYLSDPLAREKRSAQVSALNRDPAQRAIKSERGKARYADPAERAKASERNYARYADPAERAKTAEQTKARWADPVAYARHLEKMRGIWKDPEVRARILALRAARKREKEG